MTHALALVVLAALTAAWLAVQLAWRRAFPAEGDDPDALAGRLGCHGCRCEQPCERRAAENAAEEKRS